MKKLFLSLLFLIVSVQSFAVTNFDVEVRSSSGDYASYSSAESALDEDITNGTTVKVFSFDANNGTIADGANVSTDGGATTGTCIHQSINGQILIKSISGGTFDDNDVVTDGSNTVTLSNSGDEASITVTFYNNFTAGTWDGGNYDAVNTLTLQGDTSGWDGTPSGGVVATSAGWGSFNVADPYVTIKNLVVSCGNAVCVASNGIWLTLQNVIANNGGFQPLATTSGGMTCINCVSISSPGAAFNQHYNGTSMRTYNCTAINPTGGGFVSNSGWGSTGYAYNDLCLGAGGNCFDTEYGEYTNINAGYNACSDTTCNTYTSHVSGLTLENEITSSTDPHLKIGNSVSLSGTDVSGTTGVGTDIDGDERTVYWSIGADEFIAAEGDSTAPTISNPTPSSELPNETTDTDFSIDTNESAVCKISLTSGVSYVDMTDIMPSVDGITHTGHIDGLEGNSDYVRYIRCNDQSDNYNTEDYTLTISTAPINYNYVTAVWASDGGIKMARDDTWVSDHADMTNNFWDGTNISIWGSKNEVVSFNVYLEAQGKEADGLTIEFNSLCDGETCIETTVDATGDEVFDYVDRPIQNFYTRYLRIAGLSNEQFKAIFFNYDERNTPERFMAITKAQAETCTIGIKSCFASTFGESDAWSNRLDANKFYPDILIPNELVANFTIAEGESQQIWTDIYIPADTPAGTYTGTYTVKRNGSVLESLEIPVTLTVKNITLPNKSTFIPFGYSQDSEIGRRFFGNYNKTWDADYQTVYENMFKIMHAHKMSIVDAGTGLREVIANETAYKFPVWDGALSGTLFTAANGYAGPDVGIPSRVYSIGTYGTWQNEMGMALTFTYTYNNASGSLADNATVTSGAVRAIPKSGSATGKVIHQGAGTITDTNGYEYIGTAGTITIQRVIGDYFRMGDTVTDGTNSVTLTSDAWNAPMSGWRLVSQDNMEQVVDEYETFFTANYPDVERFFYFIDEPSYTTWITCDSVSQMYGETMSCSTSGYTSSSYTNYIKIGYTGTYPDKTDPNFTCDSGTITLYDNLTIPMIAILKSGTVANGDTCTNGSAVSFDISGNPEPMYISAWAPLTVAEAEVGDTCTSSNGSCTVVSKVSRMEVFSDHSTWIKNTPDSSMMSFATTNNQTRSLKAPDLSLVTDGQGQSYSTALSNWEADVAAGKKLFTYNSEFNNGSLATEDVGIGPVVKGWKAFKHKEHSYFFWVINGYHESGRSYEPDLFVDATTFGGHNIYPNCSQTSRTGCSYNAQAGNGNGVLIYPGTDAIYPSNSYGRKGFFASQRLKQLRRGFQDYDYLEAAYAINPTAVDNIVASVVPLVGWEYPRHEDDIYLGMVSWSTDPDVWDDARQQLADIILGTTVQVAVSPQTVSLTTSETQQFTAEVSGATDTTVTWSLSGSECSGAQCGTITAGGLYTVPNVAPFQQTVIVTATANEDDVTTDTASVYVNIPPPPPTTDPDLRVKGLSALKNIFKSVGNLLRIRNIK